MSSTAFAAAFRMALVLAALVAPAIAPAAWRAIAVADPASGAAEKEAFEAAKELGTVEAWDAFLSNYSSGFRADLARAYVKKLGEATPPAPPAAASAAATDGFDYPMVAGSWGGIVRKGPGADYAKVASLKEGEQVTLMGPPDSVREGDYPWFKIAFADGEIGYMWGGILCSTGVERPDLFKLCTWTPVRGSARAEPVVAPREKKAKREPEGCKKGRVMIDGRCIRKADASTHCGPGYRLKATPACRAIRSRSRSSSVHHGRSKRSRKAASPAWAGTRKKAATRTTSRISPSSRRRPASTTSFRNRDFSGRCAVACGSRYPFRGWSRPSPG